MNIFLFALLTMIVVFLGLIAYKLFENRTQSIEQIISPLKNTLEKFDHKINDMEKSRVGAYEGLSQQVKSLLETQYHLRRETQKLSNALRKPQVRGRWGEIQLQRVVELAGMLEHCDFYQQQTFSSEESRLRPDMIIKLPGNKNIIVDAKAPLNHFLEALDQQDETHQKMMLLQHARLIRDHIKKLSAKNYWEQFKPTPEFVVLFLPGETFFSAALEEAPDLIEEGVNSKVIIATPTTLIALLKAIAYGWREQHLAKNAEEISALGKELASRLETLCGHFANVGDKLQKAVESYNKTLGTLESRVLVTARKFQELNHLSTEKLEIISPIDIQSRSFVRETSEKIEE